MNFSAQTENRASFEPRCYSERASDVFKTFLHFQDSRISVSSLWNFCKYRDSSTCFVLVLFYVGRGKFTRFLTRTRVSIGFQYR